MVGPGSRLPHGTTARSEKKGVAVSDNMVNTKLFLRARSRSQDSKRRSRSMDAPFRFPQPPVLPPIFTNCGDIARLREGLAGPSGPSTPAAEYKPAPVSTFKKTLIHLRARLIVKIFIEQQG